VDLFPQTGHVEVVARFVRPEPTADLPHASHPAVASTLARLDRALGPRAADPDLARARRWAAHAHAAQVRPDGRETPYLAHPLSVTTRVALWWPDAPTHVLVAALLHDTLEDVPEALLAAARADGVDATTASGAIVRAFGYEALRVVEALTNHETPPGADKNAVYRHHVVQTVRTDLEAGPVKLSDLYDNALTIDRLADAQKRAKLARKYGPVLEELAACLPDLAPAHPLHAGRAARVVELRAALESEAYQGPSNGERPVPRG
jgi:(p)ppGpp synthase/HD superfamily hydrolase